MSDDKQPDDKNSKAGKEGGPIEASTPSSARSPKPASKAKVSPRTTASTKPKRGVLGLLNTLLLLVLIAAVAALAYLHQGELRALATASDMPPSVSEQAVLSLANELDAEQAERNAAADKAWAELRRQQQGQSASLQAAQRQTQAALVEQAEQLRSLREQLQGMSRVDRNDWLLAEAEYLMRLANQRLLMSRDALSAAELLASADQILRDVDDPALHEVRAALALEVAALEGVSSVDTEGVYLRLAGLAQRAKQLKLREMPAYAVTEVEKPQAAESDWPEKIERGLKAAWAQLKSYVRLRDNSARLQPLLSAEQEFSLRFSLQLMFEQAQLATLGGRQQSYESALTKAAAMLREYYPLDAGAELLAMELEVLSAEQLLPALPNISSSLRLLKHYNRSVHWARRAARDTQE